MNPTSSNKKIRKDTIIPGMQISQQNEAIMEAGKNMLIDSINIGRDFSKYMISTSTGSIPIYIAILKFVIPEKYVLTFIRIFYLTAPVFLFLLSSIFFLLAYFPKHKIISLNIIESIEEARSTIIKRRQQLCLMGFLLFVAGIICGWFSILLV